MLGRGLGYQKILYNPTFNLIFRCCEQAGISIFQTDVSMKFTALKSASNSLSL